jgi:hypothetical protein
MIAVKILVFPILFVVLAAVLLLNALLSIRND